MIKLLGGMLVIGGCAGWGYLKGRKLRRRCRSLLDIKSALSLLESEIGFSRSGLAQALAHISGVGESGVLFSDAGKGILRKGVQNAWKESVESHREQLCLTQEDAQMLLNLSAELGRTDGENQIKHIRYVSCLVETQRQKAEEECGKTARLYQSGGVLAGVFLALMLL